MKLIMENWRRFVDNTLKEDLTVDYFADIEKQKQKQQYKKQQEEIKKFNQYVNYVLGPSEGVSRKDEQVGIKRVGKKEYFKIYDYRHGLLRRWDGVKPWLRGGPWGSTRDSLGKPPAAYDRDVDALEHYSKAFKAALEMILFGSDFTGIGRYTAMKALDVYAKVTGKRLTQKQAATFAQIGITPDNKVKPVIKNHGFPETKENLVDAKIELQVPKSTPVDPNIKMPQSNLSPQPIIDSPPVTNSEAITVTVSGRRFMFDDIEDLFDWSMSGKARAAEEASEEFKIVLVPVTNVRRGDDLKLFHGTYANKEVGSGGYAIYTTESPHRAAGYARSNISDSGKSYSGGPAMHEIKISENARIYEIPDAKGSELWSLTGDEVKALREAGVDVVIERNRFLANRAGPDYQYAVSQGFDQSKRVAARAPVDKPWTPEEYVEFIILNPNVIKKVKRVDTGAAARSTYGRSLDPPELDPFANPDDAATFIDDLVHTGCRDSWACAMEKRIFSSKGVGIIEKDAVERVMKERYGHNYKKFIKKAEAAGLKGAQVKEYMELITNAKTHNQAVDLAKKVDATPWRGFE